MIGTSLGPYRLAAEIGSGGMGRVYLAEVAGEAPGLEVGRRVAVKVIHPHLLEKPGFFKRFLREGEIGRKVEHENVVRCFDCDSLVVAGERHDFLVMEYVEGQTLRDLLRELERVPEELCRHVGREVAKGLAAIHAVGAVHRDVKPENLLITKDHVVKVMDLGIARLEGESFRLSQSGAFVGSPEYAAPEQFRGGGTDGRADLHALGVVLYELSTGRHPFRDEDLSRVVRRILDETPRKAGEWNPQLSPFFEEVLDTLLRKDREERFASAELLARVLGEGERGEWWRERAKTLRIGTRRALRRIRIPRETALYGRDDDLARLRALYDSARAGEGRVLLLEGEAGIGKTRLVDEFVGKLREQGEDLDFLFGSYPPGGAATASGAFSTAYREHLGTEGLAQTLAAHLPLTPLLVPAFAALLTGDALPTGAEPLTKDSLQTVFVHLTRALAAERPVVVLIDDLHFAPEEGRALFASLALAVPGHRVLLVGTLRPGVPEAWTASVTRLEHAERRTLARLGPKDLARLLEDAFRSRRLAEELAYRIGVKSDGNPFFAFEIIRGLREGRFLAQKPDGTWVTTRAIRDLQVPSSVLELVQARIADLGDEERNLLDLASCCGFGFDPLLLAAVLGQGEIPVLQRLARIEKRHRLVRSAGSRFLFDHHQVQEAIYVGLPDLLRARYHAAVAAALEAREGAAGKAPEALDGALCVDLCEHGLKGGRGEPARRYLDAALTHLERGYLNEPMVLLAERALALPGLLAGRERLRTLLRLVGPLDRLARLDRARAVLEEARALAQEVGDREEEGRAIAHLGNVARRQGRSDEARALFERQLLLAREAGDRKGEGAATANLGHVLYLLGRREEARERYERHLALSRELGDADGEVTATINLGNVLTSMGRYREAIARCEEGRDQAVARGNRAWETVAAGNLGFLLSALGRLAEACGHADRVRELALETGDRGRECGAVEFRAGLLASLGRTAEAREDLERCLALAREIGDPHREGRTLAILGVVAAEEERAEEAEGCFAEALRLQRALGSRLEEARTLLYRGQSRVRAGRGEEARSDLDGALAIARDLSVPRILVLALAQQAACSGGDVGAARQALAEHEEQLGPGPALEARFLLWQAAGERSDLVEAKRLLDHLVEHAPAEDREPMVRRVSLYREILEAWGAFSGAGPAA